MNFLTVQLPGHAHCLQACKQSFCEQAQMFSKTRAQIQASAKKGEIFYPLLEANYTKNTPGFDSFFFARIDQNERKSVVTIHFYQSQCQRAHL